MKLKFQSALFINTVLFGAITCLTGCATTGVDLSTKDTNSMQTVKLGIAQGEIKTECTTGCDLKLRPTKKPGNETEAAGK